MTLTIASQLARASPDETSSVPRNKVGPNVSVEKEDIECFNCYCYLDWKDIAIGSSLWKEKSFTKSKSTFDILFSIYSLGFFGKDFSIRKKNNKENKTR